MTDRPLRADARRNREAIVAAARELVIREGPGIGMDEIATAAGVATGTLYRHFPTKQDLIQSIVADLAEAIDRSLNSALAGVADGTSSAVDEVIALLRHVMIDMHQERLLRFAVAGVAEDSLREIQARGRAAVEQLVAAAHRNDSLYPDITADDVVLLLSTAPTDAMSEVEQSRWLTLARRALTPNPSTGVRNSERG
ncbi:TetR/AcrR family transcriptional regulator [Nocardia sp. NPDC127606]|uniref:TetR/AcrR family transcriptional regulator n=1 Tax=Nocardia sp. NPDC127606 TaxID=3345406 RepID=UPI0036253071